MSPLKKIFILLYLFSSSAFAQIKINGYAAGTEVGNGGFVVQCSEAMGKTTTFFYDLYELLHRDPTWRPAFDVSGRDEYAVVEKVLQNYSKLDPKAARWLMGRVRLTKKSIYNTITSSSDGKSTGVIQQKDVSSALDYRAGAAFIEIATKDSIVLPGHCRKIQALSYMKSTSPFFNVGSYAIKREFFDPLDILNRAAARTHEALYEDTFSAEWTEVYKNVVRYNQFLFSLPDLSKVEGQELLGWQATNVMERAKNHFLTSYYAGIPVYADYPMGQGCPISLYENGLIKNVRIQSFANVVSDTQTDFLDGCGEFDRNGNLAYVRPLEHGQKMSCRKEHSSTNRDTMVMVCSSRTR